jgi:hypothetical protein
VRSFDEHMIGDDQPGQPGLGVIIIPELEDHVLQAADKVLGSEWRLVVILAGSGIQFFAMNEPLGK